MSTLTEEETDFVQQADAEAAELAIKQQRIERLLSEHSLDAILIARNENVAWGTAGRVDMRVGVQRETGAGSLLITRSGRQYYLTTENEGERFRTEEFQQLNYEPLLQPWYANSPEDSVRKVVGAGRVAGDVPFANAQPLLLQPFRFELTDAEVARYRWLGRAVAEAVEQTVLALEPGVTERDMQARLCEPLIRRSILPSVYLCAADERIMRFPHPVPRAAALKRFGMVGLCARRWGLTISMTRFVHFGAMPSDLAARFGAMAQIYERTLLATQEGASSDEIFTVIEDAFTKCGFAGGARRHHQGGATGYNEREWTARPGGPERVLPQQAFAWNPNLSGAKVEDTVVYRRGSMELLTPTPQLPVIKASRQEPPFPVADVLIR